LALRSVQAELPALILLDIKMPGLNGYEVCQRLKAEERTRSIPIIFISVLEDEREKVKGFQAAAWTISTSPSTRRKCSRGQDASRAPARAVESGTPQR